MHHVAADAVRPAEQRGSARHVALCQRLAHRGTRNARAAHLVAVHARHVEAGALASGVEHLVVARALGAEAKVVTDQHVFRAEAEHQHVIDEGLRRLRGEGLVEAQYHHLLDAAAVQLAKLVAQRGDACRRELGLVQQRREVVARVRLEGHHARRQAAVFGFGDEQREHRLVAAVHTVEVADRERAGGRDAGVVKAAKHLHRCGIIGCASVAAWRALRLIQVPIDEPA